MAKKSVIQRALKRDRLVKKYAAKRAELKKTLADPKVTEEAFYDAQRALAKLPRSSSKVDIGNYTILLCFHCQSKNLCKTTAIL